MQDSAPTCLNLLAPDGIVRVAFSTSLNGDQCVALLNVSQTAQSVVELEQALKDLGDSWGVRTDTEIVTRSKRLLTSRNARRAAQGEG